jgi:hypothetical protein
MAPATNYLKGGGKDMKRMNFRKGCLLSGILLFSALVLGQSGWACDEPDPNDYLCVEELEIKRVRLDYDKDEIQILGKNFNNGNSPKLTLGDEPLDVRWYNEKEIVTTFPFVEAGQYKLRISTGEGSNCKDKHSVKIDHDNKPSCPQPPPCTPCKDGEQGPPGPQGPAGPAGPQGPKGDKGDPSVKSAEAITLPPGSSATASLNTDTSVLTIGVPRGADGKDGAQGLPGPAGMPIFKTVFTLGEPITDDASHLGGTALCGSDCKVTGGGFSQNNLNITLSGPFDLVHDENNNVYNYVQIDNGWRVEGRGVPGNLSLTVYAVCACP